MKIDVIKLDNGQNILVEVLDIELPNDIKNKINLESSFSDLPEGAELIGVMDDMKMGMELLKHDLKNIVTTVKDAFVENQPDEFSVELNFGFIGKGSVIPLLVSTEAKGGIKIKATWKKVI